MQGIWIRPFGLWGNTTKMAKHPWSARKKGGITEGPDQLL